MQDTVEIKNENPIEPQKTSAKPGRKCRLIFSLLLLLIIAVLAAITWKVCQLYKQNDDFHALVTQLQQNAKQQEASVTAVSQELAATKQTLQTQQQEMQQVRAVGQQHQDSWVIAEAQYLARLASDSLLYQKNIEMALTLLQQSDARLSQLSDPRLVDVRKALAEDIAALHALPVVDVPGLYLQLIALDKQVSILPLPGSEATKPTLEAEAAAKNLSWWRRGLKNTWLELQKIIIVRHPRDDALPLLLPEQQSYLYQNLHAQLAHAMWGLLYQQADVYQASLAQAIGWINTYFMHDAPPVHAMLDNLAKLQAVQLKVEIPKLTNSLQAFDSYLAASAVSDAKAQPNQ